MCRPGQCRSVQRRSTPGTCAGRHLRRAVPAAPARLGLAPARGSRRVRGGPMAGSPPGPGPPSACRLRARGVTGPPPPPARSAPEPAALCFPASAARWLRPARGTARERAVGRPPVLPNKPPRSGAATPPSGQVMITAEHVITAERLRHNRQQVVTSYPPTGGYAAVEQETRGPGHWRNAPRPVPRRNPGPHRRSPGPHAGRPVRVSAVTPRAPSLP